MCSHNGSPSNSDTLCDGCQWTSTVTPTKNATNCTFEYEVRRFNCSYSRDETFTGVVTVPCSTAVNVGFPCDSAGHSTGYTLTFSACTCPTPPTS